jgi:hypothetical protein
MNPSLPEVSIGTADLPYGTNFLVPAIRPRSCRVSGKELALPTNPASRTLMCEIEILR